MRKLTTFTILVLALSVTVNVLAGTPDGMTPAEENVCDQLKADGVTKGLYGLCVAYCEAHDGPVDVVLTEEIDKMADPPNSMLLTAYQKKMREGDPQMPCVNYENSCPVWGQEELDRIGTLGGNLLLDYYGNYGANENYFDREGGNGFTQYAEVIVSNGTYYGRYYSRGTGFPDSVLFMVLTEAEYISCKEQLINHVTNP